MAVFYTILLGRKTYFPEQEIFTFKEAIYYKVRDCLLCIYYSTPMAFLNSEFCGSKMS